MLKTEGRVTLIDGLLAAAVLAGLVLNTALGWWWAIRGPGGLFPDGDHLRLDAAEARCSRGWSG